VTVIPPSATWNAEASLEVARLAEMVAETVEPEPLGREYIRFTDLHAGAAELIDKIVPKGQVGRDRCIYVIELDSETSPREVRDAFIAARDRKTLKLPQLNSSESVAIYVGSSCATGKRSDTLRSRLKQHLCFAPNGTYALRLGEWAGALTGGVHVSAWQYPEVAAGEAGDRLARQTVLAVEDWLSQNLEPMFGRRGSRN